jgi:hypothetical protein
MASIFDRLLGRRRQGVVAREAEEEQMSPAERRFVDESVEGHQADELVEEHGMAGLPPIDQDDDFR